MAGPRRDSTRRSSRIYARGRRSAPAGPVENQQGWCTVMYLPAAPFCGKNAACAGGEAVLAGVRPR